MANYTPFNFQITVSGLSTSSGNNNQNNILQGLSISKGLLIELPNQIRRIRSIGAYVNIINGSIPTTIGVEESTSFRPWYNVYIDLKGDGDNLLTFNNLIPYVPAKLEINNVTNPVPVTGTPNRTSIVLTDKQPNLNLNCVGVRKLFIPRISLSHDKSTDADTVVYDLTGFIIWE